MSHVIRNGGTALCMLLITACGGSKLYRAELPHNLTVNSKTESVTTTLDI